MKRPKYDPETFKDAFKVGDFVSGWVTDNCLRITAIGEQRFLGVDWRGRERVQCIHHAQGWIKVDRPYWFKECDK